MPLTDSRPIWDMPLNEILSQAAPSGTRASATDIPGVNLEWMVTEAYPSGAWFGTVGSPTQAQLNALPTAFLATGVHADVLGTDLSWGGADVGWAFACGVPVVNASDFAVASLPGVTTVAFPITDVRMFPGQIWEFIATIQNTAGADNTFGAINIGGSSLDYETAVPQNSARIMQRIVKARSSNIVDVISADYSQNSISQSILVADLSAKINLRFISGQSSAKVANLIVRRIG